MGCFEGEVRLFMGTLLLVPGTENAGQNSHSDSEVSTGSFSILQRNPGILNLSLKGLWGYVVIYLADKACLNTTVDRVLTPC